jgi:hypothetical protein
MPFLVDNLNCGRAVKSVVSRPTAEPYLGKASSQRCQRRDADARNSLGSIFSGCNERTGIDSCPDPTVDTEVAL